MLLYAHVDRADKARRRADMAAGQAMGKPMKLSVRHVVMMVVALAAFASIPACAKKEMTLEECRAKCTQVMDQEDAKCTMGTEICAKVKKDASASCEQTCKTYSEKYGGGK